MPFHYKALILVAVVTFFAFLVAKPVFIRFISEDDFARRRNVWLLLTVAAFLIPNYWLYVLIAAPILLYAVKADRNPVGLYLFLLIAIPPLRHDIPSFGLVKNVFALDHLRMLSLFVLLPVLLSQRNEAPARPRELAMADRLIVIYVLLQFLLLLPYETVTASIRRALLLNIDILLPYFVVSRYCTSRQQIVDAIASFAVAGMVLVPLAVVEMLGGFMLYHGVEQRWGSGLLYVYLARGELFRAQVTAGHSITLGYLFAIAFGFWLYLMTWLPRRSVALFFLAAIIVGLVATFSRGPWIGAAAAALTCLALGPNGKARLVKASLGIGVVFGVALLTPWSGTIIDFLPFVGTVGQDTADYRQALAQTSWQLIWTNPIFGNPYFLMYMEDLRQGQGIIDVVNTYASIALSYGLVTLAVFVGFFGMVLLRALATARGAAHDDPDASMLGATLAGGIVCTLVLLAATSFGLAFSYVAWSLAALSVAYCRCVSPEVRYQQAMGYA